MAEVAEVKSSKSALAQVTGVLIGPLAWGADLLISYALVQHACSTGHHYILHVVSIIAFVVTLGGALLSWRQYQEVREANDEGGSPFDRSHFLALLGVVSSLSFAIVIIASAVPRWVLSPCD
jgi:hypothetical protein